jgi:hypothetical protein
MLLPHLQLKEHKAVDMKLLGKLYLDHQGLILIHAKADGKVYYVEEDGSWLLSSYPHPLKSWRLIGDSYAKD